MLEPHLFSVEFFASLRWGLIQIVTQINKKYENLKQSKNLWMPRQKNQIEAFYFLATFSAVRAKKIINKNMIKEMKEIKDPKEATKFQPK